MNGSPTLWRSGAWRSRPSVPSPAEIAALLTAAGVGGAVGLAERMDSDELEARLDAANAAAATRGVFGSPSFFVGNEMFFGNDRLEFMREALAVTA